ncbi:MAG: hypothetical protein JXB38_15180 [Anaerolineales bacterium]|nr:hypothetical protein [Anaerolineales bacterium]
MSDSQCPHCQMGLMVAAAFEEKRLSKAGTGPLTPITPEILVPRLGEYLVENGMLTQEQLKAALDYQETQTRNGNPMLLGEVLTELHLVKQRHLDRAITEQILELQQALNRYNQHLEQLVQERTAELQNALQKLTQLNHLKNNFISNISHELRTPLAHMIGYIDLLADGSLGPLTAEQGTGMEVLTKASGRLQNLIDNLLQFSLATQGFMELDLKPISLQMIVKSAISKNLGKADVADIKLKVDVPSENIHVQADSEKIIWVLEQLLDNGIKFNRAPGEVVLSARLKGTRVVLAVRDTGIGIPPDRIDEAFEAFHQLDGSTTRRYGGTGLGLSLAKRIIEAHETTLDVQSKPGEGSCFEFSLPIVNQAG